MSDFPQLAVAFFSGGGLSAVVAWLTSRRQRKADTAQALVASATSLVARLEARVAYLEIRVSTLEQENRELRSQLAST